jgi:uncharacterized membrane protein YebE (DUF533 family)
MRISVLSFVTGAAVGYVLGAKAGRERYEQLVRVGHVTAATAGVAYSAARSATDALQSLIDRIQAAREEDAERDRLNREMEAALIAADAPSNGRARAL